MHYFLPHVTPHAKTVIQGLLRIVLVQTRTCLSDAWKHLKSHFSCMPLTDFSLLGFATLLPSCTTLSLSTSATMSCCHTSSGRVSLSLQLAHHPTSQQDATSTQIWLSHLNKVDQLTLTLADIDCNIDPCCVEFDLLDFDRWPQLTFLESCVSYIDFNFLVHFFYLISLKWV